MKKITHVSRSLELLSAVLKDQGQSKLPIIATKLLIPVSTAQRLASQLVSQRLLFRAEKGRYVAGPALLAIRQKIDPMQILAELARPPLRRLVGRKKVIAHLGVWDGEMVTYLVKEKGIQQDLFTQEGGKLEAYCSAIGRALLAHLPQELREAYLLEESFVPLTQHTETDPALIRQILRQARKAGFAEDREEIAEGLNCIAVPVMGLDGNVIAALSLSSLSVTELGSRYLPVLLECSMKISELIADYLPELDRELAVSSRGQDHNR